MEVAILSRYYNRSARGVETFARELSRGMEKLGYAVVICADSATIPLKTTVVISTNGRFDVVRAKIWCVLHGAKLIVPGQSGLGFDDRLNLFTFPDVFVCLTQVQEEWARVANPFVKTVVIPNGVDLKKFHPGKKASSHRIVLSVGALEPNKRMDLLIKAVAKTDADLLLTGEGSQKDYLRELASQLLPNRFEIGSYSHEQMPDVFAGADVFVYPTVPWESFGIAMVEAMACGLPVVATDDPIRREIVGKAGLFCDPTDTAELSRQIIFALSRDWGDLPRDQALKYDWDKIALQYDELIKRLCSR